MGEYLNKDLVIGIVVSTLLGTLLAYTITYASFQPALEDLLTQMHSLSETIDTLNQTATTLNQSLTEIRNSLYYYTTIAGKLVYVGNPCTTSPCLPGIVLAVSTETALYYLTVGGTWLWDGNEDFSWNGYAPRDGDHVIAIGYARMKCDLQGNVFSEIEILSLTPG